MRKGSLTILWITAGLLASATFLFLAGESTAGMGGLQMPNLKGQFQKQNTGTASQVQLQADQVSYSSVDNKAHAQGNVVVTTPDKQLYCDQLQLDRVVQQVVAEGNVYLDTPLENVIAKGLTYNFNDGTGEFRDARVFVDPYQMKGKTIDKISENYFVMKEGYMTTSDWDEPDYRIAARRMDIYQHDRALIHGMKIYLGKVPVMYLPYYDQDLKNRPIFTFIPGHSKDFGMFLLTTMRLSLGPRVKLSVYGDLRERTGLAEGFDLKYSSSDFGSGILRTYYAAENKIAAKRRWKKYDKNGRIRGPTTHHELYRIIWRHQWQIDPNTNAIWQIYKIHDWDITNNGFLKKYFPREFQQGEATDSYFLLTRNMPHGTLTFHIEDTRINRPLRGVEYYPQIQYMVNNEQIGRTGFYFKSANDFSNVVLDTYPKTVNKKTTRFDTNNDISRPFKLGFIQFNPHIGGEETYYTRTAELSDRNLIRGMFRASLDMTTKFYKVWDYHANFAGLNIDRLRHVITPTVTYLYQYRPTFPAGDLNQFDAIDDLYRIHQFEFGLENQLQTKRSGQIVDLLRVLITTIYGLKGTTGLRAFNPFDSTLDFLPTDWFTFHNDNEFDYHAGHWNYENFDGTIHGNNLAFSLGRRWARYQGDQLTGELDYTINPKWKIRLFGSFPVTHATHGNISSVREYEYVVTRDLHEWEMDVAIDQLQGQGSTFYILFRLKAMPNMKFNLVNTLFHASRPGKSTPPPITGESQ